MKTNNRTNSNIKNDQINKDNLIEETENKKEEQGKKIEEKQEKGEKEQKIHTWKNPYPESFLLSS